MRDRIVELVGDLPRIELFKVNEYFNEKTVEEIKKYVIELIKASKI